MFLEVLREWLCPNKCIVCRSFLEEHSEVGLCLHCEEKLLERDLCPRCGKPYGVDSSTCSYCDQVPKRITRVLGLFPYVDLYKESVLRWKYTGIRKYAKGYGALMASLVEVEHLEIDCLIPIPIARHRYLERGFNQALDLAEEVSRRTSIPVWNVLERAHDTKPQSACKKEERAKNIYKSIQIKESIRYDPVIEENGPINIAFLDDIYTTGSTVAECIRALKQDTSIQVQNIYVLTVCLAI